MKSSRCLLEPCVTGEKCESLMRIPSGVRGAAQLQHKGGRQLSVLQNKESMQTRKEIFV